MNNLIPKLISLSLLTILSVGVSAADTNIKTPSSSDKLDLNSEDLVITWDSENDMSSEKELFESQIVIEDDLGNIADLSLDRSRTLSPGQNVENSYNLLDENIYNLSEGVWQITVRDLWRNNSGASPVITSDSVTPEITSMPSMTSIELTTPSSSYSHNIGDSIDITWDSKNNVDYSRTVNFSEVKIIGGDGRSHIEEITRGETISGDSSSSYTTSVSSEDLDSLSAGTWTLEITDAWNTDSNTQTETVSEKISFNAESSSDTGESTRLLTGSVDINIDYPSDGSSLNISEGFSVNWESLNEYNGSRTLGESRVEISGADGRSVIETVSRNSEVSAESSESYSQSFSSDRLSDLINGNWTVSVEDTWASGESVSQETVSRETYFTAVSDTSSDSGSNDSEDDGSNVIIGGGSSDSTGSSDGSESTDDSDSQTGEESSTEDSGTTGSDDTSDSTEQRDQIQDPGSESSGTDTQTSGSDSTGNNQRESNSVGDKNSGTESSEDSSENTGGSDNQTNQNSFLKKAGEMWSGLPTRILSGVAMVVVIVAGLVYWSRLNN